MKRRRVVALFLKGAGNKGDEAIFMAFCRRVMATVEANRAGWDFEVAGFGPSGISIFPFPSGERELQDICAKVFAPARDRRLPLRPDRMLGFMAQAIRLFVRRDFVFFCGGHWIHDLSLLNHLAICGWLAVSRFFGARTGVFGIGAGPLRKSLSRKLLRLAFGESSLLVFRDARSVEIFKQAGFRKAYLGADLAVESGYLPNHPKATKRIGISPCAWFTIDNLYQRDAEVESKLRAQLVRIVETLAARGWSVSLIPTMFPEDGTLSRLVISDLSPSARARTECFDDESATSDAVVRKIADLTALISMRLHPAIFAFNAGVPFVALDYSPKVRAFCERYGWGRALVSLQTPDWADQALASLERVLDSPPKSVGDPAGELREAYEVWREWLTSRAPLRAPAQDAHGSDSRSLGRRA